jgi:hypothetical protein
MIAQARSACSRNQVEKLTLGEKVAQLSAAWLD